jgi:hypothetical protein
MRQDATSRGNTRHFRYRCRRRLSRSAAPSVDPIVSPATREQTGCGRQDRECFDRHHVRRRIMRSDVEQQGRKKFDALLYLGAPSTITMSRLPRARCADERYMTMRLGRMELAGMQAAVARLNQYCAAPQAGLARRIARYGTDGATKATVTSSTIRKIGGPSGLEEGFPLHCSGPVAKCDSKSERRWKWSIEHAWEAWLDGH